jgi:RNA polymerase primary sigma factor
MTTKPHAKKTAKAPAKPAKSKPVKAPAKSAASKGAAVKKSSAKPAAPAKPVAKPAKTEKPAAKIEAKVDLKGLTSTKAKPDSKTSDAKTKTETKPQAKPAVVPGKKPLVAEALKLKKIDGKIVPPVKPGAKAPGEPGDPSTQRDDADSPLLDMSDVGVRKMITRAKQRGYVTYDELNKVLPSDKTSSEQIEDTMAMLSEMGINVVESEEQEEQAEVPALVEGGKQVVVKSGEEGEQYDRTDDPVRMYLREMGSVELLSREGEIAIAKRIEAGRELMIGALCESPLTFEALTVWRDELNEGKVLLRDIIDLEAMYGAGPDGQPTIPPGSPGLPGMAPNLPVMNGHGAALPPTPVAQPPVPPPLPPRPEFKKPEPPKPTEPVDEAEAAAIADAAAADAEDFDDEGNLSLSAMELALKPQVLETLDQIAALYKKLGRLQDASVEAALSADAASRSCASRPSISSKASSSTTTASKRLSTRCTASIAVSCRSKAVCCVWLKRMASIASISSSSISATSSIPTGRAAWAACRVWVGTISSRTSATASSSIATRFRRWRPRCASRSWISAASCRRCKKASAKAVRQRRK